ncbi:hypothetical protein ABLT32_04405 [Bacteroides pyogenes]|uniref:hypothetical protein n=1 Tax=Bacteroides pyogenes TaxID=310300 RepID=UPI004062BC4B
MMKICPICHEEVEDSFEICWNCNYSFPEGAIIELPEGEDGGRSLDCLRCHTPVATSFMKVFRRVCWATCSKSFRTKRLLICMCVRDAGKWSSSLR